MNSINLCHGRPAIVATFLLMSLIDQASAQQTCPPTDDNSGQAAICRFEKNKMAKCREGWAMTGLTCKKPFCSIREIACRKYAPSSSAANWQVGRATAFKIDQQRREYEKSGFIYSIVYERDGLRISRFTDPDLDTPLGCGFATGDKCPSGSFLSDLECGAQCITLRAWCCKRSQ